jgi:hypothetical protein
LAAAHYKNAQKHSHGCLISISIRLGDAKSWSLPSMDSKDLAQYIQATDSISKPWLLVKMRLKKLQENKATLSQAEYLRELEEIHQDMMNLSEWWHGRKDEVFGNS